MKTKFLKTKRNGGRNAAAAVIILSFMVCAACDDITGGQRTPATTVTAFSLQDKVTPPVRGAVPDTTGIDTEQCTGTVEWFENDGTTAAPAVFAAKTVYKAVVTLTAKEGWTFEGFPANSFDYSGATSVTNGENSGVVTITFRATAAEGEDTVVNLLSLKDKVTAPVRDEAPVTADINTTQYTGTVAWKTFTGEAFTGSVFAAGTVYKAVVTLTAKTDYTFTGLAANSFTYTGATSVTNGENSGVVTITFPATEMIDTVTPAPAAKAATIAKTAATQAAVDFTLTNETELSGTWKVYSTPTGSTLADGVTAAITSWPVLRLSHATDIPEGSYYVSVTEEGKLESARLKLVVSGYVAEGQSATPAADETSVNKTAAVQQSVNFTLTSSHTGVWKVYSALTGGEPLDTVSASFTAPVLTLTSTDSNITEGNYYVSVTEDGKTESNRLELTVKLPAISGTVTINGTAKVGAVLTVTTSGFTGTLTYQWKAGGSNVGTNINRYTVQLADYGKIITVTVSASGSEGSVTGSMTAPVDYKDLAGGITISGTMAVTCVLTVNTTGLEYERTGVLIIEWTRNGETGIIGTESDYTLVSADAEHTITVTVKASKNTGSKSAVTNGTISAVPPLGGTVTITGTAKVGETLTADTSGLTNQSGTLHYQWISHNNDWEAGGDENVGTDAAAYTLQTADSGKYISVTVSSSGNSGSVKSNPDSNGRGCIGPVEGASLESLAAVLAALGDTTSAESPATVPLGGLNISETWASVNAAVQNAGKYVILDLSACTATGNTITTSNSLSPTGNDMAVCNNNTYLKGIILPNTLTSIGDNAFYGCTNLTSVGILASVTTIGVNAFYGCSELTGVIDLSPVTTFVEESGSSNAFKNTAITGVILGTPSGTLNGAFSSCSSLTSVTFATGSNITTAWANFAFGLFSSTGDALWALYSAESRPLVSAVTFEWNGSAWGKK